ncbi:MAG TPA: superoxide dismutase family protein [Sphingomicrobium sp.]|nr:superoxide dismutase family protein [Sphingomicrobium sp.]
MRSIRLLAPASAAFSACAPVDLPVPAPPVALVDSSGESVGSVVAAQTSGGVTLTVNASGLPHGLHGIHVHATGRCDAPKFESAGAHWNPAGRKHGLENPDGSHAGDLPNVTVSSSGVLQATVVLPSTSLAELADSDGSALVLHAGVDDYVSDPSGNSGARIACAVLAPAR